MAKRKKNAVAIEEPIVETEVAEEKAEVVAAPQNTLRVWYPSDIERAVSFRYVNGVLQENIHGKGLPPRFYPPLNMSGHAYVGTDGWHILDVAIEGLDMTESTADQYVRELRKRCMQPLTADTCPRTSVCYPTCGKASVNSSGVVAIETMDDPEYEIDVRAVDKGINGWKHIVWIDPILIDGETVSRLVLNAEPPVKSGKARLVFKHGVERVIEAT